MHQKIIVLILFTLFSLDGISQKNVNNYAYVIVPLKYDFLKEADQYRLNTMTRHLFKQNGFTAFFDVQDLPEELLRDRCKALNVDVEKLKGGLFKTKLDIVLKDCYGKEIFRSRTGSTREKNYKDAYFAALKDAFVSIEELDYTYQPENTKTNDVVVDNEVIEVEEMKQVEDVIEEAQPKAIVIENISVKSTDYEELYYAQAIDDGYQLVNAEPRIVMTLLNTAAANVFLVKGKSAIVYKEDGFWYYSENDGKLKEKKVLKIKF